MNETQNVKEVFVKKTRRSNNKNQKYPPPKFFNSENYNQQRSWYKK